jgi:hypothetical protein
LGICNLLGRFGLGFALARRQKLDGAPDLSSDAQSLVDRFGRRSCLDGGERARCGGFGFHRRNVAFSSVNANALRDGVRFGPDSRASNAGAGEDSLAGQGHSATFPDSGNGLLRYAARA